MNLFRKSKQVLPPFYVITLAETPWRREECIKHFISSGVSDPLPIFVDGVHGASINLRPNVPFTYTEKGENHYMHAAAVGAVLSHRIALSCAISSSEKEFVIFEDDALLCPNFPEAYLKWREELPSDIEVAQLEFTQSDSTKAPDPISETSAHLYPYPFCAAAIWWTRPAAKVAITQMQPINQPLDIILIERVFPRLQHCVASPPLVRNRSIDGEWPSAIGPVTDEYKEA